MAILAEEVKNVIDNIAGMGLMLPGLVWTRPIIQPGGNETTPDGALYDSTPEAFDPAMPVQILRCASINTLPRSSSPSNWTDMYADYVEIWYYGPDTPDDRVNLQAAMEEVRNGLYRRPMSGESGTGIIQPTNDRTPLRVSGEFFHAVYGVERFGFYSFSQ